MGIFPLPVKAGRGNTAVVENYYIVDWILPPTQLVDLRTAQRAIETAGRRLTEDGHPVRCVHSTYVPAQRRWVCVFTAASAESVRKAHEIAQLPIPRIETALDVTPMDRLAG